MRTHGLRAAGLAILMALCPNCGRATAEDPQSSEVLRVSVRYDDLDLSTAAGARRVLLRIRSAAAAACSAHNPPAPAAQGSAYQLCVVATVRTAVAHLNAPQVTTLLRGQTEANEADR